MSFIAKEEIIFPDEPIKIGDEFVYPIWEEIRWFDLSNFFIFRYPNDPEMSFAFTGFKSGEDVIKGTITAPLPRIGFIRK